MNYDNKEKLNMSRHDILSLLDSFIDQIHQIRRTLLGVSISALVLSPLAIALSIYLMLHPSFFAVLEIENEFGLVPCCVVECSYRYFFNLAYNRNKTISFSKFLE